MRELRKQLDATTEGVWIMGDIDVDFLELEGEVVEEPKHRMYCAKSGLSCLVEHNGPCLDVTDCEACKAEKSQEPQLPEEMGGVVSGYAENYTHQDLVEKINEIIRYLRQKQI